MTIDLGSNITVETENDVLGGNSPLESDVYDFTISMAYISKAASGAMAVNLTLETEDNKTLKQTIYISSGDKKGNKFTYTDKKTNQERPLPGYVQIDSLCKLAIGTPLNQLEPENKVLKIYDPQQSKEVPKEVPVLQELLNAEITAGVLKVTEDKMSKDASGNYVPTGEVRTVNALSKFFKTEGRLTNAEIKAGLTKGEFVEKWQAKNKGIEVDKTSKVTASPTLGGVSPTPQSSQPTTKSLFN